VTTLDSLINQDLDELQLKSIEAYEKVYADKRQCCKVCEERNKVDYKNWNPVSDYNHTWNIVDLLQGYGYTSMEFDAVTYEFYLENDEKFMGRGIGFPQAVCNCLILFADSDYFARICKRKNE